MKYLPLFHHFKAIYQFPKHNFFGQNRSECPFKYAYFKTTNQFDLLPLKYKGPTIYILGGGVCFSAEQQVFFFYTKQISNISFLDMDIANFSSNLSVHFLNGDRKLRRNIKPPQPKC